MKFYNILIAGLLFFCIESITQAQIQSELIDMPVPKFELGCIGTCPHNIEDHIGKPFVLDFWTVGCRPCIQGMPDLIKICEENKVHMYAINVGDKYKKVIEFLKKRKEVWPVLFDRRGIVASRFKVKNIPFTVYVNKEGIVKEVLLGQHSKEDIQKAIDKIK